MIKRKNEQSVKIKINKEDDEINKLIEDKVLYIQDIIRNTIISIQNYKKNGIFSNSDVNICTLSLNELYEKTNKIIESLNKEHIDSIIDLLQQVIDKLSIITCGFGTLHLEDMLYITFGSEFLQLNKTPEINAKFDILKKYFHPTGFKIVPCKFKLSDKHSEPDKNSLCINKITDEILILENSPFLECFDCDITVNSFLYKIHGIKVVLHSSTNKTMIIHGIIDDINIDFFNNIYISKRKSSILDYSNNSDCDKEIIKRQVEAMTLKDILIYSNNDIIKKYSSILLLVNNTKNTKLESVVKKFIEMDTFSQRNTLIDLLIYDKDYEIQYITYMLYDLISTTSKENSIDSTDQMLIYDSFPWKIKCHFKDAMKNTIKYTQDMNQKYDMNRITLEQQIFTLRVPENVKEKAMAKIKEIKGKSDESNIKAKQYLEGLLKIPFNTYKEESILKITKKMNNTFKNIFQSMKEIIPSLDIPIKQNYTNIEISKYIEKTVNDISSYIHNYVSNLNKLTINQLNSTIKYMNTKTNNKIISSKINTKHDKLKEINQFIESAPLYDKLEIHDILHDKSKSLIHPYNEFNKLNIELNDFKNEIEKISKILDDSIYGQTHAKNQILKIICQWITGELSGYCFGFEGSPGIGKTSLAKKGLANCLKDYDGETRPFSFIALGGSCNGSTLEGHSYTYVNSTWGRITDILMESKCMNPIIYVDELDKVSKSEHGKEIIGILTHLIDSTQNDSFQDKYFSGINLDLSKALFIFSYNDVSQIDRILLDRIHRIKFENLTSDEKLVIVKKYIIPEINKKMGFYDIIDLTDDIIKIIIDEYTSEPGVRKLKEILFDMYGEINIELLKLDNQSKELPIKIIRDDLENKYLKKYDKITETKIHSINSIGIMNGLWANSLGKGGIIPIEAVLFPSSSFLEFKLTGLQGDVMKESMNVAKTLAWNLCSQSIKNKLLKKFEETKSQGIHVHCPEGAVSKDGPSAGTAITVAIYSLLNEIPIHNNIAITGEINLQGKITAIGGLNHKVYGGIKAGITKFLYPKDNHKDYIEFIDKHGIPENIEFIEISKIEDVFPHVFVS